jgi:hypothetical protein
MTHTDDGPGPESFSGRLGTNPEGLQPGSHPGFSNLTSRLGVYRCKLHPVANKADPKHADYAGVLPLTGSKASVLVWVHADGTLGLRLEKIEARRPGGTR